MTLYEKLQNGKRVQVQLKDGQELLICPRFCSGNWRCKVYERGSSYYHDTMVGAFIDLDLHAKEVTHGQTTIYR